MGNLKRSFIFIFVFTFILGVLYPAFLFIFGAVFFDERSNGCIFINNEKVIGALSIGQKFTKDIYFWPRYSASDWNTLPGHGSHITFATHEIQKVLEKRPHLDGIEELRYASASGLDPHISLQAAYAQVDRIAKARNADPEKIRELITTRTHGFWHKKYVNVLELNLVLEGKII